MPVLLPSSPSPHLKLSTWGRGRGRLGVGVWVPSRRRGWGGCGFWQWPSPAAGGHQAARVRRCGAASVAPWPETLRAKASATSSSTVGSGPGRGMKARGPIPRALPSPPLLGSLELVAARLGTSASLPALPLSPVVSPTAASRNHGMRLWPTPLLQLPRSSSAPSPLRDCILHLKDRFPFSSPANECAVPSPAVSLKILRSKKRALFTPVSLIVYIKTL